MEITEKRGMNGGENRGTLLYDYVVSIPMKFPFSADLNSIEPIQRHPSPKKVIEVQKIQGFQSNL